MIRFLSLALIGSGVVLCILGLRAHDSTASWVTRLFSGSPTKESVMLLAGGGAAVLAGVGLLVAGSGSGKRRRSLGR